MQSLLMNSAWLVALFFSSQVISANLSRCEQPIEENLTPKGVAIDALKPFAKDMNAIFAFHCKLEAKFYALDDSHFQMTNNLILDAIEEHKAVLISHTELDEQTASDYLGYLRDNYLPVQQLKVHNNAYYEASRTFLFCQRSSKDCADFSRAYFALINLPQKLLAEKDAQQVNLKAIKRDALWDKYLDRSLVQMPWELFVNSRYIRKRSANNPQALTPPKKQWLLLRPGVVFDYVANAKEGSQAKATLMLEAFGVNYWQMDKWYIPSGVSLAALYTDREGVEDIGAGLVLRFKSRYILGASYYGSDDFGAFLSIDLLNMFRDKKQSYLAYFAKAQHLF